MTHLINFISGDRADEFVWIECEDDDPECIEMAEGTSSDEDPFAYDEEQMNADDPRIRLRAQLAKIGQDDKIPEDASPEELQALIDKRVAGGLIPEDHAEKLRRTMLGADKRKERLERMNQNLFDQ